MGHSGQELGGSSQTESGAHVNCKKNWLKIRCSNKQSPPHARGPGEPMSGFKTTHSRARFLQQQGVHHLLIDIICFNHHCEEFLDISVEDRKLSQNQKSETCPFLHTFRNWQIKWRFSMLWYLETN